MTASNDITGDLIKTKLDSVKNYRDNYDMIFRGGFPGGKDGGKESEEGEKVREEPNS